MNKLIIAGYLGKDCQSRDVGQQRVLSFSVGVNKYSKEAGKGTEWFNCSYWVDPAKDGARKFLTKGMSVVVEGEVSARHYKDKSGNDAVSLECRVKSVEPLGGGKHENGENGFSRESYTDYNNNVVKTDAEKANTAPASDDLPF